jgi:hypothetical protein
MCSLQNFVGGSLIFIFPWPIVSNRRPHRAGVRSLWLQHGINKANYKIFAFMAVNFDVVLRVFQLTHNMGFGEKAALSSRMDELVHETLSSEWVLRLLRTEDLAMQRWCSEVSTSEGLFFCIVKLCEQQALSPVRTYIAAITTIVCPTGKWEKATSLSSSVSVLVRQTKKLPIGRSRHIWCI